MNVLCSGNTFSTSVHTIFALQSHIGTIICFFFAKLDGLWLMNYVLFPVTLQLKKIVSFTQLS